MDFIFELLFEFVLDLLIELIAAAFKGMAWLFRSAGRFAGWIVAQCIGRREAIYFTADRSVHEPAESSAMSYPTRRRSDNRWKTPVVLR
jgi:hypothetical protein